MRCNIYKDRMESALERSAVWNRVGTVLTPAPLKRENTQSRPIKNRFCLHEEPLRLVEFCMENSLDCPQDPRKYVLCPASPRKEAGQFYFRMDMKKDAEAGTTGRLRIDFGRGKAFHSCTAGNQRVCQHP